jgi:HEAT repeat protein
MNKLILAFFIAVLVSGCQTTVKKDIVHVSPEKKLDIETVQKVESILKRVENIAEKRNLDELGRSTMSESVELMDIGAKVTPVLIDKLKISENWKLRYWIVDLLGYIPNRQNVIPLVEVVEDNTENQITRIRACDSLKELRYNDAVEHLLIAKDIVKEEELRNKIQETIDFLR